MVRRSRLGPALGVSAAAHFALVVIGLVVLTSEPARAPIDTPPFPTKFVFVASPSPRGGGGGGGNPAPAPRQPLEIQAHRPPNPVQAAVIQVPDKRSLPELDVPVETDAARILRAAGLSVAALAAPAPGGGGRGTGLGPGQGPGVNAGEDGGTGGAQPAGGDVSSPILVKKVEPRYTSAAMVAKITGVVVLEVVIKADGTVGAVRVAKSLDTKLGLDQAAIDAAKEWTFKPGMRRGQPVDVIVTLILEFRLH
jgi:periplasmic protein TonB